METILVADDVPDVLDLARDILEAKGYTVLTASDGEEALRVAQRHPGPIHCLLTDVVMPKMNGPELAERLKLARREAKVVFMSGYTSEAIGEYGIMHAGAPFVAKPFTASLLSGKVREALDYRSPFRRPAAPVGLQSPALA
jgi:two-component system cell cycle sensor histidine kinase/response regulator CckA